MSSSFWWKCVPSSWYWHANRLWCCDEVAPHSLNFSTRRICTSSTFVGFDGSVELFISQIWLNTFGRLPWDSCRSDQGLCRTDMIVTTLRDIKKMLGVSEPFRTILRPSPELTFGGCTMHTAGLDILCGHKEIICHKTERTTLDLKIRTKSSHWGASTDAEHNFISSVFGELYLKTGENCPKVFVPRTVGCATSKALMRMSQELLKCLSLAANIF